ncbi:MAG: sulfotransferase, partial [Myxococcota bacterium]
PMSATDLQLRRTFTTAAVQYADHLRRSGRPDQAITVLSPVVKVAPDDALGWLVLGLSFAAREDLGNAASALRQAVQFAPGRPEPWVALGRVLAERGIRDEPVACFRRALACAPDHLEALVRLSTALLLRGDREGAIPLLDLALAQAPDHPGALAAWARLKLQERAPHEIYERLQDVLEPHPDPPDPRLLASVSRAAIALGDASRARPAVERALTATTGRTDRLLLYHAQAELCDAMGEVDEAWTAWRTANELRGSTFDPVTHEAMVDSVIERTRHVDFGPLPEQFDDRIVLAVGIPRSGSTLLEQALSRHPELVACGELEALRDVAYAIPSRSECDWIDALPRLTGGIVTPLKQTYVSAMLDAEAKAKRYLDKMPNNLLYLGLLARIAPGARVIVVQRDSMAVGFSCYRMPFGPGQDWATRLHDIGTFIRSANRLLDHWRAVLPLRFHTVDYDDLVTQPEAILGGVVDFLGLERHDDVFAPESAGRTAGTVSQLEVLQPIHQRSTKRWHAYAAHLEPLRVALEPVEQRHPTPPGQAVAG